jgi:hypothetical protein
MVHRLTIYLRGGQTIREVDVTKFEYGLNDEGTLAGYTIELVDERSIFWFDPKEISGITGFLLRGDDE